MSVYTTEITSDLISSDNPLHQRLLKSLLVAAPFISGRHSRTWLWSRTWSGDYFGKYFSFHAIDKIPDVINKLRDKFPEVAFTEMVFPPVDLPDETFDTILSFQVIEHIKDDHLFLREIARILKPGGKAIISTPNHKMTLSRNPWHIREYMGSELKFLAEKYFSKVEMKGIAGSKRVMEYHEKNRVSVNKIMRWDILNLQHLLPAWLLKVPYELLNRRNRNSLETKYDQLVMNISQEDYFLRDQHEENLDLFVIMEK